MFSLLGLVLVLRGSRVVVEHHHQQMATHPNNFQEEMPNLLMIFMFFFCFIKKQPYIPSRKAVYVVRACGEKN